MRTRTTRHTVAAISCAAAALTTQISAIDVEQLVPDDMPPLAFFGKSVAISGDVALVGAFLDNDVAVDSGAAGIC